MEFKIYEAAYVGCFDGYDPSYEWRYRGTLNIPNILCKFNFTKVYYAKKKLEEMGMGDKDIFLTKNYKFFCDYEIEQIVRDDKLFI